MLSAILAIGIIALFLVGLVFITYTSQKEKQERIEMSHALGFTPVDEPDSALLERIAGVHFSYGSPAYLLRNVMRKSAPYNTIYLYDLWNTSGSSSSRNVETSAVAVIAPGMNLPFVVVYPRLAMGGALANLANQFIEQILTMQGLTEIDFPDIPELDEKFFITGEDENAIRALFTPVLSSLLLSKPTIGLQAKGDTLSISLTNARSTRPNTEAIRELVEHATLIYDRISRF